MKKIYVKPASLVRVINMDQTFCASNPTASTETWDEVDLSEL